TVACLTAAGPEAATKPKTAPEFRAVDAWINTKPLKLADLRGKVVLVHFWTHGCINCIHNYPHYRNLAAEYKGKQLVMVGIHTPEFAGEAKIDAVKAAAVKNKLEFPIAVDNQWTNWKAWENRYWPAVYLVDKQGRVRYRWDGELGEAGEKIVRRRIDELTAEAADETLAAP
ncbi:MAG: redoxin domain-containing protein, partial [Planctomycetia bacterium]